MKEIQLKTDITKTYLIPMARIGDPYGEFQMIEVSLEDLRDGSVRCTPVDDEDAGEYEAVYFVDDYFQWMLYRKQVVMLQQRGISGDQICFDF